MKTILLLLLLGPSLALAEPILSEKPSYYYGEKDLTKLQDEALKNQLFHILSSHHISRENLRDQLVESCKSEDPHCYHFQELGYKTARQYLFGYLDLEEGPDGYEVTSVYCLKRLTNKDFPSKNNLGPMKIPEHSILNAEHSWPQSKFSGAFPKGLQKSDLHHLFPSQAKVNSTRGNHPFGEVQELSSDVCEEAALGTDGQSSQRVFEPSDHNKGNVARALFYFSVRYKMKIDPNQEKYLRKWHEMDPVDDMEKARHQAVYGIQFTRNPFIDYPELVKKISDF